MEPRLRNFFSERNREIRTVGRAERALLALFALTTSACNWFEQPVEDNESTPVIAPESPEQRDQREFIRKIAALEKDGCEIQFVGASASVTAEDSSINQVNDVNDFLINLPINGGITMAQDVARPSQALEQALSLSEKRKDVQKKVNIPAYHFTVQIKENQAEIKVKNWITNSDVTDVTIQLVSQEIKGSFEKSQENARRAVEQIVQAIQQDRSTLYTKYAEQLKQNGVDNAHLIDIPKMRSEGNGIQQLKDLIAQEVRININGYKRDFTPEASPYIDYDFFRTNFGEYKDGTLEIGGTISSVEFTRTEFNDPPAWWEKPGTHIYQDKYKNTIMVEYTFSNSNEGDVYQQAIFVSVPTPFHGEKGTEVYHVPVSIDLQQAGLGTLENIIYESPERPTTTTKQESFQYYGFIQGKDNFEVPGYQWEAMFSEIAKLQQAFYGDELEQQLVSNVLVIPTTEVNGYFQPRNSTTIAVTQGFLEARDLTLRNVRSVARHETAHALFNHLLKSDQELDGLMRKLTPDFYKAIAESNFQDKGFGGHPGDQLTELFASFMNAVMLDDVEQRIGRLQPDLAREFAVVARTFRTALEKPLRAANSKGEVISILESLRRVEQRAEDVSKAR